jgi:hypothetical protein
MWPRLKRRVFLSRLSSRRADGLPAPKDRFILPVLAALLIVLCWSEATPAQTAASANAGMAAQITKARKVNAALMRQCSWNSRVEVLDQGVVKDLRIELVNTAPWASSSGIS